MLRRKLILALGPLILMVLAAGVLAIMLYGSLVAELSKMGDSVLSRFETVTRIDNQLGQLEASLGAIRESPSVPADGLMIEATRIAGLIAELEQLEGQAPPHQGPPLSILHDRLIEQVRQVDSAPDGESARVAALSALDAGQELHKALWSTNQLAEASFAGEHARLVSSLRWWSLGMGLVFLVVINVSIMVLIRAAGMVLRPVDQLVEASRHLAREEFDYRVDIRQKDEFAELALATNHMAEQLQSNERRRVEMLQQIARSLNHELNNAIATIDMQLTLVARRGRMQMDPENERRLRDIHEMLRKMSSTVSCLTHVRRVVLTDYIGNVKMVDLKRSMESEQDAPAPESRQAGARPA